MILTMVAAAARGGIREGAGRKSAFPGKILDKPFAMDFTPAGRKKLDALSTRHGLSRNDVMAHLALRYGDDVKFDDTPGVVFAGKAQKVLAIRLPQDAADVLTRARKRTGKSYSDIGEELVRHYGPDDTRFPLLPEGEKKTKSKAKKRKRSRRYG